MYAIFVTFVVSKLLKPSDVRLLQPLNIEDISVTCDVSKLLKSRAVRLLQFANI